MSKTLDDAAKEAAIDLQNGSFDRHGLIRPICGKLAQRVTVTNVHPAIGPSFITIECCGSRAKQFF